MPTEQILTDEEETMVRLVRLAKGSRGPETIGVAIPPSAFTTDEETLEGSGKTWEQAGYKLDSYEDTHEPYEMTPADRERVASARAERAAAREDKAAPAAEAPRAEKKG